MFNFGNWDSKTKWLFFSERQIKRVLDILGFKIVLCHKNLEQRFMAWNTYHLIAQRSE
jgi:hypothetical protein